MRNYRHFLFYAERIEAGRLRLGASETRHAATVLRTRQGDPFLATDGQGTVYECAADTVNKKEISGLILDRRAVPRQACRVHAVAGIPERAAFEALVADLTALGVERITPLVCRHCQGRWWERDAGGERLTERLRGKMIAAMKQSLYPYLPRLDPPLPFERLGTAVSGTLLEADPDGVPVRHVLEERPWHAAVTCIAGPPGGFAPEEKTALKAMGAAGVRLAPARLTTQLAAVALCCQVIGEGLTAETTPHLSGPAA